MRELIAEPQSYLALQDKIVGDKALKIALVMHSKPDGDAMGSALAMMHYLRHFGHLVEVVVPSDIGEFLAWLPGIEHSILYTKHRDQCNNVLREAELIFCLDFSQMQRVEYMEQAMMKTTAPICMLDHHIGPQGFDNYRLWREEASATAELVYEFITTISPQYQLSTDVATCIYTGLMTDTGSFRFSSVSPAVHEIVASLLRTGMDHTIVHQSIYDTFNENRLRFFGHCFKEKMVIMPEFRTAYIYVSLAELKEYSITTGDTEGLVNYPLSLTGIIFVGLIIERDGIVKVSMRSKGEFPANEFAGKYFNGGGHYNAAGGSYKPNLEEAVEVFVNGVNEYADLLKIVE
ncbi:MAG: DHH family phosphoesterase [Bacteroidota bacterium]|nr:DHH family phosphoesterase [Bacteroidota bacterium]